MAGKSARARRGTTIFFFKRMLVEDRDAAPDAEDRTRAIPMLRAYNVFNGSQIEGIPAYVAPDVTEAPWRRPEAADIILTNSKAVVAGSAGIGRSTVRAWISSNYQSRPRSIRLMRSRPRRSMSLPIGQVRRTGWAAT